MITREEMDKMTKEEVMAVSVKDRKAAFLLDLDDLLRSESKKYDDGLTVTDEIIGEEKTYKNGKVIAMRKAT